MKQYFCILSFLILTASVNAQRIEQYYDYKWRPVAVDKALFFSIVENEGDLYHRRNYYIREDKLQMDGYFSDSRCKEKQGDFYYFYPNGNVEIICSYLKNKLHGGYTSFYNDGMMKDSSHYSKGNIIGSSYSMHQNGMFKDSVFMNGDGSGISVSWHQNGMPSSAGYYAKGEKPRGTWQYFHFNGKLSSKEKYENGQLDDISYFDENGYLEKDGSNTDHDLSFTGGDIRWKQYVSTHAIIPVGWEISKTDSIVVVVSATIDEEGKVTGAYVSAPFHPAFDQVALNLVVSSPPWIPAISHHRKIKTLVHLPITFSGYK